ncbi:glycoside hydrolase family 95 protein [Anaerocolumna sedimenticola]|nr:glycoside hydrolase family 95 protein [Anaerocolumna sedimenticola]
MKNLLMYDKPAEAWEKGMALGNGRVGPCFWVNL